MDKIIRQLLAARLDSTEHELRTLERSKAELEERIEELEQAIEVSQAEADAIRAVLA